MRRRKQPRQRLYRGIPIREARASIHVQPNQKDIDGATQEDPTNCAYARCLRRTFESPSVWVFKTIAYVGTLDEQGNQIIERYTVKKYAREYIIKFDHGEKVAPGGFVFHKPQRSQTLKYKQDAGIKARKVGKFSPRTKKGSRLSTSQFSLRNGKGKVHLFGSEDQIKTNGGKK